MAIDPLKPAVDEVVDLALDVILSRESEAGWFGKSILGRMEDFGAGAASGQSVNDLAVWKQGRVLGSWSGKHKTALELLFMVSEKQRQAMLINRAYLNKTRVATDPSTGCRIHVKWTSERIGRELGISRDTFRKRASEGYRKLYGVICTPPAANAQKATVIE